MTDRKDTSQPQNPMGLFQKTFEAQIERLDEWCETMDEWQSESIDRTEEAIDQFADASKDTLAYVDELTEEWRRTSLETLRDMNDQFGSDE